MTDHDMRVMMSSERRNWATPQHFFDSLNEVYDFTLDVCAEPHTAKCKKYFTAEQDGLKQSWQGERCFMNPPYGRGIIREWVMKAALEAQAGGFVVGLLPVRTDTEWFQDFVFGRAQKVLFVRGRLKFDDGKNPAPFASCVAVWDGRKKVRTDFRTIFGHWI